MWEISEDLHTVQPRSILIILVLSGLSFTNYLHSDLVMPMFRPIFTQISPRSGQACIKIASLMTYDSTLDSGIIIIMYNTQVSR